MINIAIVGGFWGTNIGNAFMHLGAKYVLEQVFPNKEVNIFFIYDRPKYNNFLHTKKIIPVNSYDYVKNLDIDYFVIVGPTSIKYFIETWGETIGSLIERGKKYIYLGAGLMRYDEISIKDVKKFFKKYQPVTMTTRDRETYNTFKDTIVNIYDGIDMAFFISNVHKPVSMIASPLIVSNFDKIVEPIIEEYKNSRSNSMKIKINDDEYISLFFPSLFTKVGLKTDRVTDAIVYALSFLPYGTRAEKVYEYDIIRTDHRITPLIIRKAYRYKNSFCADIPDPYLNLYANTTLTISDRIHACVATLSYGNPAMLFAKSNRNGLLDRVDAGEIYYKPTRISLEYLNNEKILLIEYLRNIINAIEEEKK